MSRLSEISFEPLEPYDGKLSCTVLRGERGSNAPDLPDFIKENYTPEIQKDGLSFLSRSFERHFNERPFLNHTCYLFLTKTTKDDKWTQIIDGMTIYTDTALKAYLEQAGFCQIQSHKSKKGWLCVTAQKRSHPVRRYGRSPGCS